MRIVNSYPFRSQLSVRPAHAGATLIALGGLALLQGCTVNAPSCEGRFEPINLPAPVEDGPAPKDSSSEQEPTS